MQLLVFAIVARAAETEHASDLVRCRSSGYFGWAAALGHFSWWWIIDLAGWNGNGGVVGFVGALGGWRVRDGRLLKCWLRRTCENSGLRVGWISGCLPRHMNLGISFFSSVASWKWEVFFVMGNEVFTSASAGSGRLGPVVVVCLQVIWTLRRGSVC